MILALYTIPTATDFIAGIGSWSSAIFDELYPLAIFIVGMSVGVLVLVFLMRAIIGALIRVARGKSEED